MSRPSSQFDRRAGSVDAGRRVAAARAATAQAYGAVRPLFNAAAAFVLGLAAMLAAASGPARGAEATILALGDSLTAGYGLPNADAFTTELEDALRAAGHDVRVVNAGVSGDTSKGGRSRVDWLLSEKPDVLLLELGSNDGLRALDPAQTYDNLAAIIEKARGDGVHVLLAGMKAPPNLGAEYGAEFNAVFPRLAEEYDVTFYPFFLKGVAAQPALNQDDGMHPNAEGVDVIVDNILPSVLEALARAGTISEEAARAQRGETGG